MDADFVYPPLPPIPPPPGARPLARTHSAESYSSLTLAIKAMTRFGASSYANLQGMGHSDSTQKLYHGGGVDGCPGGGGRFASPSCWVLSASLEAPLRNAAALSDFEFATRAKLPFLRVASIKKSRIHLSLDVQWS